MSDPFEDRSLPRGALAAAAGLVLIALGGAAFGRFNDHSTAAPQAQAVASRQLHFSDRDDGAVVITEDNGALVTVVEPGTNGFLRGVLRGLAQERMRRDEGAARPFELTRWSDGRLSLTDPVTDRHVYLEAFGPSNVAPFAALLDARPHGST